MTSAPLSTDDRPTSRLIAVDVIVVVVLTLLATSPFQDAYGGLRWLAAILVGAMCGLACALLSRRFAWGSWSTALLLTVCYLLLGPAFAVPDMARSGFLPDLDSLRALLTGVVNAWRDSLTMITPLGSTGTVLIVPWVIGLVTGVGTGSVL